MWTLAGVVLSGVDPVGGYRWAIPGREEMDDLRKHEQVLRGGGRELSVLWGHELSFAVSPRRQCPSLKGTQWQLPSFVCRGCC